MKSQLCPHNSSNTIRYYSHVNARVEKRVKFRRDGASLDCPFPRRDTAAALSLFTVETSADFDAAVFSSFPIYGVHNWIGKARLLWFHKRDACSIPADTVPYFPTVLIIPWPDKRAKPAEQRQRSKYCRLWWNAPESIIDVSRINVCHFHASSSV